MVHFIGYLRSDLSSNLKYTEPNLGVSCNSQAGMNSNNSSSASLKTVSPSQRSASMDSNNQMYIYSQTPPSLTPNSQSSIQQQQPPYILSPSLTSSNESSSYLNSSGSSSSPYTPNSNSNSNSSNNNLNIINPNTNYNNINNAMSKASSSSFRNYHSVTLLNTEFSASSTPQPSGSGSSSSLSSLGGGTASGGGASASGNSSLMSGHVTGDMNQQSFNSSSGPVLQYYLIAYCQVKHKTDESTHIRYISKHDVDGKFIFLEPR